MTQRQTIIALAAVAVAMCGTGGPGYTLWWPALPDNLCISAGMNGPVTIRCPPDEWPSDDWSRCVDRSTRPAAK
jgi:hypothetical protein